MSSLAAVAIGRISLMTVIALVSGYAAGCHPRPRSTRIAIGGLLLVVLVAIAGCSTLPVSVCAQERGAYIGVHFGARVAPEPAPLCRRPVRHQVRK